jgi:1-aminocyclopropane-1-carboxylate deaminase/D-cysteine desulfhydrase-like pyridoxal-dependent ACC family enzyme
VHLGWPQPGSLGVLEPPKKYSRLFARCHSDYFCWQAAFEHATGVTMDLIYAPKAWLTLEAHATARSPLAGAEAGLCVLHTGGTSGNAAMHARCLGSRAPR